LVRTNTNTNTNTDTDSANDAALAAAIGNIWQGRTDRYSLLRAALPPEAQSSGARRVEMSYIGG